MKESGNIRNSWTKAIEKTVRKFCTTASRIKKDAVKSVKAANIAIGISAITIGKMKLEQLKKKLPNINISIDYTRTWKDSLQLGLGIVTTGGGPLLTLAGGGSEIASVGSSSAISIPAAAEGIGIAGSGLAISFDALRNMFDVRIQKSESNKGNGCGESNKTKGNITERLDTNEIPNMTKQEIIDSIPDDWEYTEHNGFVHIKDETGKMRIRIDPPDKMTKYPYVHAYDNNGNLLDRFGNIVDRTSPAGHLPYKN